MQDAAEKLQQLEKDASAANQEVVQLADELETRDDRIAQLQEEAESLRQLTRQHEETLAGRYGLMSSRLHTVRRSAGPDIADLGGVCE